MANAASVKTYFITDAEAGSFSRVKIGRTSKSVAHRLASLQIGSPRKLRIVLTLDGDHERVLHLRFADERKHGEWFKVSPRLEQFIVEARGEYWVKPFYIWLMEQLSAPRFTDAGRLALLIARRQAQKRKRQLKGIPKSSDLEAFQHYFRDHKLFNPSEEHWPVILVRAFQAWKLEIKTGRRAHDAHVAAVASAARPRLVPPIGNRVGTAVNAAGYKA